MIRLTRLDGTPVILNADLIRYVEQLPDTYITLVSGDRLIVRESMDRVMDLAIAYQQTKSLLPKIPSYSSSDQIPEPPHHPTAAIDHSEAAGGQAMPDPVKPEIVDQESSHDS